ncbi:FecR domain-containing protein [Stenotrophomonas sp. PS02297]|uniref:FecR domain-containing protein n=1 Tax=Stenotrophomonas sp. PS02297 TaxID=2991423 RepID=UPI002499F5E7|nr:FecR domain-containing protein [Stenotrophomonas sp. PS02297]
MGEKPDPLWDPDVPGDDALQRLTSLLGVYRHAHGPVPTAAEVRRPGAASVRRRFIPLAAAVALAACLAGFAAWVPWRLQWSENRQWAVETRAHAVPAALGVGQTLATAATQSATIRVARIGRVEVMPLTRIRLTDTRTGHHRIELLEGRIRARIWAPPGQFGIATGTGETVDLGCAFEMDRNRDGGGRIHVTSGWIMHSVDGQETLVPAGSYLDFTRERSGIPLAVNAAAGFRTAVGQFDRAMSAGQRPADTEALIARTATAADRFTLLTLLTRYPALASGPLYPRLTAMFDGAPPPGHRDDWLHGSVQAMNLWWEQIPRPPKAWWLNWRDALD